MWHGVYWAFTLKIIISFLFVKDISGLFPFVAMEPVFHILDKNKLKQFFSFDHSLFKISYEVSNAEHMS